MTSDSRRVLTREIDPRAARPRWYTNDDTGVPRWRRALGHHRCGVGPRGLRPPAHVVSDERTSAADAVAEIRAHDAPPHARRNRVSVRNLGYLLRYRQLVSSLLRALERWKGNSSVIEGHGRKADIAAGVAAVFGYLAVVRVFSAVIFRFHAHVPGWLPILVGVIVAVLAGQATLRIRQRVDGLPIPELDLRDSRRVGGGWIVSVACSWHWGRRSPHRCHRLGWC
jgi:hypothetical protein